MAFNSYSRTASTPQNFKFGGKEEQEDWGVGVLDFEARMYDATIGRFMTVDPHADSYHPITPYNFGFNNPVLFTDPTGMDNVIYLVLAGDYDPEKAQEIANQANAFLEELGLETRVQVHNADADGDFDADNLDDTDNWAVVGTDRDAIVDKAKQINPKWGDYLEQGNGWANENGPEESNDGSRGNGMGIVVDDGENNLNRGAKDLSSTEGSAISVIHGAGHSTTRIYESEDENGNPGHTTEGVMRNGRGVVNDLNRKGLGYVMDKRNNATYTEAMKERYGTNKSKSNYKKKRNRVRNIKGH